MNQSRRTALKSTGAFATLVSLGIVTQSQAQAAVDHASFQVKTLEDALKAIGGTPATSDQVSVVSPDIAEQTRVTLDNVRAVLEAGGTSIANVVRVGVYLRSMDDFAVFNRVFKEYFQGIQPARTTVEAAPPRKGVNVEIDAVAWVP